MAKDDVFELDKVYNHKDTEGKIYKLWESKSAFTPKADKKLWPFSMIMPPPNANDDLHIGHARFITIEDIIVRFMRMRGYATLWLPGADHAGIETQYLFEKRLNEKGQSRFDYDQDELYKMIWEYVFKYKGVMEGQLRALGASCDWSRSFFTLEIRIKEIVYKVFKKLYDDGLVYRGEQIVNYCTKCGTAYSQLEVDYKERTNELYYLDYGTIKIATTRPETIFADVAIAVHPNDRRYKKLIGKHATVPLINREIPIISDVMVDINYGSGGLKITPGHDAVDFEIGKKHRLPIISVVDRDGKMVNVPQKYAGLRVNKAREAVVEDLTEKGLIVKTKRIEHLVGTCYRCKSLIEPTILKQWFIKVSPLAKGALRAIQSKEVRFTSLKYEKIAKHWLKNLRDWNISRQIVWGMRIPAWKCNKCLEWTITDGEVPESCAKCNSKKMVQEKDTFDTWFSSAQWPYATLLASNSGAKLEFPIEKGKNKELNDFNYFYPTNIMETGYDIIPFWVIRMIMMGIYATGSVPFKEVLIHGLVRDSEGQKISKSKGNVINPLIMAERYGADALRMGLVWGSLVENDISLSEDNIRGQRNFANKVWNVSRFILRGNLKLNSQPGKRLRRPRPKNIDDKNIYGKLDLCVRGVTKSLDKYRLNEAAELLYNFIWNDFANDYLESAKGRMDEAQDVLEYVLGESLKLLHPFMPFLTEEIWQLHYSQSKDDLLISVSWPNSKK